LLTNFYAPALPFTQGAKPLGILFDYLGMGIKPDREFYYTKLEIKIRERL
jgi:hypothetical protein